MLVSPREFYGGMVEIEQGFDSKIGEQLAFLVAGRRKHPIS